VRQREKRRRRGRGPDGGGKEDGAGERWSAALTFLLLCGDGTVLGLVVVGLLWVVIEGRVSL